MWLNCSKENFRNFWNVLLFKDGKEAAINLQTIAPSLLKEIEAHIKEAAKQCKSANKQSNLILPYIF
jgi:hypothetical protein